LFWLSSTEDAMDEDAYFVTDNRGFTGLLPKSELACKLLSATNHLVSVSQIRWPVLDSKGFKQAFILIILS